MSSSDWSSDGCSSDLHPLVDSGARFFVVDPTFVGRLEGLSVALTILNTGVDGEFSRWRNAQHYEGPLPDACDLACIMYTSGTTGAPKGVLMPHAHCFLFGLGVIDNLGVGPDDHYYICLPFSHEIGRPSCTDRVGQYVYIQGVPVSLKKKNK